MDFENQAFVTLANTYSEVSLFVDPFLIILRAYGPVYRFIGREADEVEGQELFALFTSESSKKLSTLMNPMRNRVQKQVVDESIALEKTSFQTKNLNMLSSGGSRLVEIRVTPRRDSGLGGGAYYYMVVINDLSHTMNIDKKKNSFLGTMNHELRTPLNGIIGLAESLRSGEKENSRKKHFDMMLNSARCMLKLVNKILETSAMRNNVADLDLFQVQVNDLVEEVVELMHNAVDKRGRKLKKDSVDLTVQLGDYLPTIDIDKTKVFEAIEAILNNALKFTHKGHVVVKTTEDDESHGVRISVEDSGIGIAKDAIDRIFDAFEQEDDDHENRKFEGLGLGLTLAKEVAALHGGKLWVESEVGVGSKFYLTIPPNARALKLISEKLRLNPKVGISNTSSSGRPDSERISQKENNRMELVRVKQAEQIDLMQGQVVEAMKAISNLTVDLELFEGKLKAYNSRGRGAGNPRSTVEPQLAASQLSVASNFLSSKTRSYEVSTTSHQPLHGQSRLHRNFGLGTNFIYSNHL